MFEKEIERLRTALSEENRLLIEAIDDLRKEVQELSRIIKTRKVNPED